MNKKIINEKFEASIVGGAIGDALGLPVEMKTKEFIRQTYGRVEDFLHSKLNVFYNKAGFDKDGGGFISDDTLLTIATMDALSDSGNIDFANIAQKHSLAYFANPYGFGRGTKEACEKIRDRVSYLLTGNPNSTGNGIMMKQASLAFYFLSKNISEIEMERDLEIYSRITHDNKIPVISAIVHNKMLINLIINDNIQKKRLISDLWEYAKKLEKRFYNKGNEEEKLSDKLEKLLSMIGEDDSLCIIDDEILDRFGWGNEKITKSCYILCTLPIVYALFLRNPDYKGFIDAINIGGDTDSYGAIIGNMIGAYRGRFYNEELENGVKDIDIIKRSIKDFQGKFLAG